jgi:hypothetical protein
MPERAARVRAEVAEVNEIRPAADIMEQVLISRRPVLRGKSWMSEELESRVESIYRV